jgi:hypothetical protein
MAIDCIWELRHCFATDNEEYWYVVCDTRFTPHRVDATWSRCPYCGRRLRLTAKDAQGKRHLEFIGLSDLMI